VETKDKKKKLTLKNFSGNPVNLGQNFTKGPGNKSVVVEKKKNRSFSQSQNQNRPKQFFSTKPQVPTKGVLDADSQKSKKIAEEWARKKIEEELEIGNKKKAFKKGAEKKREHKLALSNLVIDDENEKQRSYASFKRAKEKEKKIFQQSDNENLDDVKKVSREVFIPDLITIQELSNRMAEKASSLIKFLFEKNVKVTINHTIDKDTAEYIVTSFGHKPVKDNKINEEIAKLKKISEEDNEPRSPVVTVMGHVDHGKTSLLDSLRQSNVVATEHGGITQHIGAYQVFVDKNDKWITFIDTPGHAAFTEMRARGSKITDIVVLVVAANDGIKPQTVEAIQHAKAAKVPIIVAINKCDIHGIDTRKIRNQLLEHELVVEDLGGDIQCIEISALKKTNLDKLKEAILLQAEILNLRSNTKVHAQGVIVESRLDKGKGAVSTVLITKGTLKKGDFFVCGLQWGKIRLMNNFKGDQLEEAKPSMPVEIIGLSGVSQAGDDFLVLENEAKAKEVNLYRVEQNKVKKFVLPKKAEGFQEENKPKELQIIIKSDVHGSAEALSNAIIKIEHAEVKPVVLLSAVGSITETDVSLAKASSAILIGFNIKPSKEAKDLSAKLGVNILYFNIIYEALEHINKALSGLLEPEIKEEILGQCEILQTFKSSKVGKVAGIKVLEGIILNNADARILRDGTVIYTGKIVSLYREKNEVKEIKAGIEGGTSFKDFLDFKEKDVIEIFKKFETARTIN